MSEWQPIETAPRDDRIVLTYWRATPVFAFRETDDGDAYVVAALDRGGAYCTHGNYRPFHPTHWMPLPSPPATGKE